MSYYFHSAISWRNSLNKKEKINPSQNHLLTLQLRPEIDKITSWAQNALIVSNAKSQTAKATEACKIIWRGITCPCCKAPLFEIAAGGGMKWLLKKSQRKATVEAGTPRSAEGVHYDKKALGMKNKGWGMQTLAFLGLLETTRAARGEERQAVRNR